MTSPVARTLEVLELLQSAGVRTATELAQRFEVDERTIRRTVERLRDLGIPVDSVQGRHGGYRIAAGWRMPPLMFDESETIAVLTALLAAQRSPTGATDDTASATAIAKIRRSLPRRLAERADALLATAVVDTGGSAPSPDPEALLTAAAAVRARRMLAMTYWSGADEITQRTVQPHDLVAYRGRWYLVGLDSLSGQRRTFRLDRVRTARLLSTTFAAPAEHQPLAQLLDGFAGADYTYRVRLDVNAAYDHIRARLPASVAVIEPMGHSGETRQPTGDRDEAPVRWWRVTIRAQHLDWLPPTLLALNCPVVIDEPDELRDLVSTAASHLSAMATTTNRNGAAE